jgi:hypothetical protein
MSNKDKEIFLEKIKINFPAEEHGTYEKILLKHHDNFSLDKDDLGLDTNLKHRIDLKN